MTIRNDLIEAYKYNQEIFSKIMASSENTLSIPIGLEEVYHSYCYLFKEIERYADDQGWYEDLIIIQQENE